LVKSKPQTEPIQTETTFGSDLFISFFYSTAWFGSILNTFNDIGEAMKILERNVFFFEKYGRNV